MRTVVYQTFSITYKSFVWLSRGFELDQFRLCFFSYETATQCDYNDVGSNARLKGKKQGKVTSIIYVYIDGDKESITRRPMY